MPLLADKSDKVEYDNSRNQDDELSGIFDDLEPEDFEDDNPSNLEEDVNPDNFIGAEDQLAEDGYDAAYNKKKQLEDQLNKVKEKKARAEEQKALKPGDLTDDKPSIRARAINKIGANKTKSLFGGGGILGIVGLVMFGYNLILPFKAVHIAEIFTDFAGERIENQVENKMERYLFRKLFASSVDALDDDALRTTGKPVRDLIYNKKTNKLAKQVQKSLGITLEGADFKTVKFSDGRTLSLDKYLDGLDVVETLNVDGSRAESKRLKRLHNRIRFKRSFFRKSTATFKDGASRTKQTLSKAADWLDGVGFKNDLTKKEFDERKSSFNGKIDGAPNPSEDSPRLKRFPIVQKLISKIPSKIANAVVKTSSVVGIPLVVLDLACTIDDVDELFESLDILKTETLLRSYKGAASIGHGVKQGDPVNPEELGDLMNNVYSAGFFDTFGYNNITDPDSEYSYESVSQSARLDYDSQAVDFLANAADSFDLNTGIGLSNGPLFQFIDLIPGVDIGESADGIPVIGDVYNFEIDSCIAVDALDSVVGGIINLGTAGLSETVSDKLSTELIRWLTGGGVDMERLAEIDPEGEEAIGIRKELGNMVSSGASLDRSLSARSRGGLLVSNDVAAEEDNKIALKQFEENKNRSIQERVFALDYKHSISSSVISWLPVKATDVPMKLTNTIASNLSVRSMMNMGMYMVDIIKPGIYTAHAFQKEPVYYGVPQYILPASDGTNFEIVGENEEALDSLEERLVEIAGSEDFRNILWDKYGSNCFESQEGERLINTDILHLAESCPTGLDQYNNGEPTDFDLYRLWYNECVIIQDVLLQSSEVDFSTTDACAGERADVGFTGVSEGLQEGDLGECGGETRREATFENGDIEVETIYGITVNTNICENFKALYEAAEADGIRLEGWGFRSHQRQKELRVTNCDQITNITHPLMFTLRAGDCRVPTAIPGRSKHEVGRAIDFCCTVAPGRAIRSGSNEHNWLVANAGRFGFSPLASEAWHWSVGGG